MSDTPTAPNAPPGWYPDLHEPQTLRWWDGSAWRDATRPRSGFTASEIQSLPVDNADEIRANGRTRSGTRKRSRKPDIVLFGLVVPILLGLGLWAWLAQSQSSELVQDSAPETFTVEGTITVDGTTTWDRAVNGRECFATGGYSDINIAQVILSDDSGATLVVGHFDSGKFVGVREGRDRHIDGPWRCSFSFTLLDVPEIGGYYTLTVGNRGEMKFSRSELDEPLELVLR